MATINWGILGAAGIAKKSAIPGIMKSKSSNFYGLASSSKSKIESFKSEFGEFYVYETYEDMLKDPQIDAVYIPLPNHLHVEWIKKSVEAGKHVLCEKPIALNSKEVEEIIKLRNSSGKIIGEAFMVRSHPRWKELRRRIEEGEFGHLEIIQGLFTYYNTDSENIRNAYKEGGGGMWDIGCYLVQFSRYIYNAEPEIVSCYMDIDPEFGIDRMTSAWMKFPSGQVTFQVSTQAFRTQFVTLITDKCSIEVPMTFNPSLKNNPKIIVHFDHDPEENLKVYSGPIQDQFELEFENFSRCIMGEEELNIKLEDSLSNTRVLEALFRSAASGKNELVK